MVVPHPALPQKIVLDEDLLLSDANDNVVRNDRRAAPVRMLLAERPQSPLFVLTTSTTTPDGCVGGGGTWGGGFFVTLLSFDTTMSNDGMGDVGCFARTKAPHITHSTEVHLFLA
jgi:hypothetical protein